LEERRSEGCPAVNGEVITPHVYFLYVFLFRKRCNIAQQLISNPAILFLDEPTSGLDAFQALSVMESMKQMSRNGWLSDNFSVSVFIVLRSFGDLGHSSAPFQHL
jgi:ABC-type phosphonate transport system ATPase subunit